MLLQDDHAVVQDLSKKPEHLPGKGLVCRLKNRRTKKSDQLEAIPRIRSKT